MELAIGFAVLVAAVFGVCARVITIREYRRDKETWSQWFQGQ